MEITKIYPLDAVFDNPEDVPEEVREKYIVYIIKRWKWSNILDVFWCSFMQIKTNKRYAGSSKWTVQVWIKLP